MAHELQGMCTKMAVFVLVRPILPVTDTKMAVFVLIRPILPSTDTKMAVFVLVGGRDQEKSRSRVGDQLFIAKVL